MAVKDIKKKLDALVGDSKSNWANKAKERLANKSWLKHSRRIAIKINIFLKANNIKQKQLAELLNVSPQQVSKIIKGRENLTLETISKIEDVLKIQLIEVKKVEKTEVKESANYVKPSIKANKYTMNEIMEGLIKFDNPPTNEDLLMTSIHKKAA